MKYVNDLNNFETLKLNFETKIMNKSKTLFIYL